MGMVKFFILKHNVDITKLQIIITLSSNPQLTHIWSLKPFGRDNVFDFNKIHVFNFGKNQPSLKLRNKNVNVPPPKEIIFDEEENKRKIEIIEKIKKDEAVRQKNKLRNRLPINGKDFKSNSASSSQSSFSDYGSSFNDNESNSSNSYGFGGSFNESSNSGSMNSEVLASSFDSNYQKNEETSDNKEGNSYINPPIDEQFYYYNTHNHQDNEQQLIQPSVHYGLEYTNNITEEEEQPNNNICTIC
ncbi:hypothetical protein Mgra_00003053 [Meloidogyne graminicola]|uniref:Uncharacterized protein n=1 Tax=Meloidogyne graminicola TaxID=189291 RepID=A0A8S9ZWN0_9BILA|nr:hypothetical protein Mgra_00003053 [Meloidogyne graminicola]